ncbi:hypothetical protein ACFQ7F_19175 [Streptomyces sp. NPDC056486]|uniref:hypothetical protein n=1 Tax=Streptomyces sp. NPDC056486 TaxID=3345835 RepID=UPI0036CC7E28
MAAESFSAAGDISGTDEPLVSTSVHWGTVQLGAPTRDQPALRPHTEDHDTDQAAYDTGPGAHDTGQATYDIGQAAYDTGQVVDDVRPERAAPVADEGPSEETTPGLDADAVEELLRVAVVSRPLDDVVDLVTLLEQSPDGMPTAASVLRLAAVARSVDDVTQLVELLGPPEHPADHMDEAIRHAAEERPIPEVSRLVHLLSRPPHDPHSGAEAVHAAGTTRSVEDLMQLIGSLKEHQEHQGHTEHTDSGESKDATGVGAGTPAAPMASPAEAAHPSTVPAAGATHAQGKTLLAWLRRTAGILLLLCAAAHFPLNWSDAPTLGVSAALGVVAVCAVTGAALCLSGSPIVALASTLVAGALTVSHLVGDRVASTTLSYVLRPDGVTAPIPALSAVAATLASLLVVAFTVAGLRAAANRNSKL